MQNIVYLNGDFCASEAAKVSAFDRGFLFADGVYEVIPIYNGKLFKQQLHWDRLGASIDSLALSNIKTSDLIFKLNNIAAQLIEKNNLQQGAGKLYVQITRGTNNSREHLANPDLPTIFITANKLDWPDINKLKAGAKAITIQGARANWQKHKTISNLQNIIGLQQAEKQNAVEAIWHDNNIILEGCHSNVFYVKDNVLYTPSDELPILTGVTRNIIIELAAKNGIKCIATKINVDVFCAADEIFITGSTKTLLPICKLNNKVIGTGSGGKIWRQLFCAYQATIKSQTQADAQHDDK